MGGNGGFEREIHLPGGSFSKLLLSSDDAEDKSFCLHSSVSPNPLFSSNTPNMLCFGDFISQTAPNFTLSSANTNLTTSYSNKRRNGSGKESENRSGNVQNSKNGMKKKKPEMGPIVTTSPGHAKLGRREKLGERITILQQLVSPYGKTDTASVLHEAMGYIRFLHDQVKVLSTPYLKRSPSSSSSPSPLNSISGKGGPSAEGKGSTEGLRSRGLCLVPLECIIHVADSNGADFWSSATISSSGP